MPNLFFITNNTVFKEDLQKQIELYAPEFGINEKSSAVAACILDEQTDMLNEIRKKYTGIPVFILLKKGEEKPEPSDLVRYISKPFALNTFLDELRSSVNLAAMSKAGKLFFNTFELDPLTKEIYDTGRKTAIKLTEKEVAIIQYLYKNSTRVVARNELLQEVWGYNPEATTHTIETHIYRLRQKIEHDGLNAPFIITEDGGYILKK